MQTRTREQLIQAITARMAANPAPDYVNEELMDAYNKQFFIEFRPHDPPLTPAEFLANQMDAFIRDVFAGGVTYSPGEKLGFNYTADEFRELPQDEQHELIATALRQRFGGLWGQVLFSHSQPPGQTLSKVIKYSIPKKTATFTVSVDTPTEGETRNIYLDPTSGNIYFVTRIERMPITDNDRQDKVHPDQKRIIGYLDGPMETIYQLQEVRLNPDDPTSTVWKYQLVSVASANPQILAMFEGQTFLQSQLPAYEAMITDKRNQLQAACQKYLLTLLFRFGKQLGAPLYPASESFTTLRKMDDLINDFANLKVTVTTCLENNNAECLQNNDLPALINFARLLSQAPNIYALVKQAPGYEQWLNAIDQFNHRDESYAALNKDLIRFKQHVDPKVRAIFQDCTSAEEFAKFFERTHSQYYEVKTLLLEHNEPYAEIESTARSTLATNSYVDNILKEFYGKLQSNPALVEVLKQYPTPLAWAAEFKKMVTIMEVIKEYDPDGKNSEGCLILANQIAVVHALMNTLTQADKSVGIDDFNALIKDEFETLQDKPKSATLQFFQEINEVFENKHTLMKRGKIAKALELAQHSYSNSPTTSARTLDKEKVKVKSNSPTPKSGS